MEEIIAIALPARGLDDGVEFVELAVLALESCLGAVLGFADVFAVDDQPLLAALHLQDELGDRGVGDAFEGAADAAFLRRGDPAEEARRRRPRRPARELDRELRLNRRKARWST